MFVPPSHKHLTTQNQNFNVIILWWCRSIGMCNFGPKLISDSLILNAKVMGTMDAQHIWKGRGSQQQQPANFLNQVGVGIWCRKSINACKNLAESFCSQKTCLKINVQDSSSKFWPNFFKNGPFLSHYGRFGPNIWHGLVSWPIQYLRKISWKSEIQACHVLPNLPDFLRKWILIFSFLE